MKLLHKYRNQISSVGKNKQTNKKPAFLKGNDWLRKAVSSQASKDCCKGAALKKKKLNTQRCFFNCAVTLITEKYNGRRISLFSSSREAMKRCKTEEWERNWASFQRGRFNFATWFSLKSCRNMREWSWGCNPNGAACSLHDLGQSTRSLRASLNGNRQKASSSTML